MRLGPPGHVVPVTLIDNLDPSSDDGLAELILDALFSTHLFNLTQPLDPTSFFKILAPHHNLAR